ncbi:MAG: hypothetical protein JWR21_4444 [Herminiimonas sp.]|nr:hypothetical protein [Herminiimonas sp.]
MPIRRRTAKRRVDDLRAWEMYLESGHDFFNDLPSIGLFDPPPRATALEAWRRLATVLLATWAEHRHPEQGPAWAVREFGIPRSR